MARKLIKTLRAFGAAATLLVLTGRVVLAAPQDKDVAVTFDWPEGVTTSYFTSKGITDKEGVGKPGIRENSSFTATVPEGKYLMQLGQEVLNFQIGGGHIVSNGNAAMGIRIEQPATIHFTAVPVTIDTTAFPKVPLKILGNPDPIVPPGTKGEVKIVPSRYQLNYGSGTSEIVIQPTGKIFMQQVNDGFVSEGNTLRLAPRPIEFKPGPGLKQWSLNRYGAPAGSEPMTLQLLPGQYEVVLKPDAGGAEKIMVYVGTDFRISNSPDGPWQEAATLTAKAGGSVTVSQPGGVAVLQTRAVKAAEGGKALDAYLAASDKAPWKQDFTIHEYMGWYDFPEELLSYKLTFPAGKVKAEGLQLANTSDGQLKYIPFQLDDVVADGGFLTSATLHFRSDLPKNATRAFRLTSGLPMQTVPADPEVIKVTPKAPETTFQNDKIAVRLTDGEQEFKPAKPLLGMPAPILAMTRDEKGERWIGNGIMAAPPTILVTKVSAKTTVKGPMLATQKVTYTFEGNNTYTVEVSLRAGDAYVTLDEYVSGFKTEDGAFMRFGFEKGLDPDQRQAMGNGGYASYSGAYDKDKNEDGQLPMQLGLNSPNSIAVMRTAAFWKTGGPDVLIFALNRMDEWKTARRLVWSDNRGAGVLFWSKDGKKYAQTRLDGKERHWAMGLVPLTRNVPGGFLRDDLGAGPEVRLWQKLSDFSLNAYKDWPVDWEEDVKARPDDEVVKPVTFDEWMYGSQGPKAKNVFFLGRIPRVYWDYSAEVAPVSFRSVPALFRTYAASREKWTLDQRKQARTILLFLAYSCAGDANMAHKSMMSGQPNFVMDVKQTMPIACATFPNYPMAKVWKQGFMDFLNEFLDTYQRKPNIQFNSVGGRWTENTAAYSGTVLKALDESADCLKRFDGTDLMADPRMQSWIRWYRDIMTSPQDGMRRVPPEGAHSNAMEPGTPYWNALFDLAKKMATANPQLSAEMHWIETNGKEGKKPNLKSVLINDGGGVLRNDFGGPNEAYLRLMQISGRWNYRWGKGGDMLYYGAKGKLWSYNSPEANGDQYQVSNLTAFQVSARGLGTHDTDQPLYDFGFAQFLRVLSNPDWGGLKGFKSRNLMMLRDDYIAIYDDVAEDELSGKFTWVNKWELPQMYNLKPGGKPIDTTFSENVRGDDGKLAPLVMKRREFRGTGDFLTIVAPTPVEAKVQPYGGTVNGEYVFFSDEDKKVDEGGVKWEGTIGYARPNQLAIFEGKSIGLNGFELSRDEGDFGVSAEVQGKTIRGRFTGKEGGKVTITPPAGFDVAKAKVKVNGEAVAASVQGKTLIFPVTVKQADGTRDYVVTFE